ncbi:MAG: hypothetical protein MJ174_11000 [Treponema sp.]|nr:hypothetical protein [Treponema sp.]
MKMTKKLLIGAAVAMAAVMFVGCSDWSLSSAMQKAYGTDIFDYTDATYDAGLGTWTIDKVNDTTDWIRGAKLLQTKHSDMSGKIDLACNSNSEPNGDGVIGIVFDVTQNKGSKWLIDETTGDVKKDEEGNSIPDPQYKTWNFGIVGVRFNADRTGAQYYVSHYYNISDANMAARNFGAYDESAGKAIEEEAYDASIKTPYEIVINDFTALPASAIVTVDGVKNISVVAQVIEDDTTGDYVVNFYKGEDFNEKSLKLDTTSKLTSSEVMKAAKIGKTGPREAYVGVYANVYIGQTLNGKLEIADLTNDAVVVE